MNRVPNQRRHWTRHAIVVLIAAGAGALVYWYPGRISHDQGRVPGRDAPSPPTIPSEPARPLPEPDADTTPLPAAEPLPPLAESDAPFFAALRAIFDAAALDRYGLPEHLIERLVTTIDSLDGKAIPPRFRPLRPIEGPPLIAGEGDEIVWDPANAARYRPLVEALGAADPAALAALYRRHAPLFQQAYVELGYPGRRFDDRLSEIIDHLLATPEPEAPLRLTRPKVLYQFADENLETLSWGQKTLLRIGPENRAVVRAFLQRLRDALNG